VVAKRSFLGTGFHGWWQEDAESGRGQADGCRRVGLDGARGRGWAGDTGTSVAPVRGVVYSRLTLVFPRIRIWFRCWGNMLPTWDLILRGSPSGGDPKWCCP